MSTSTVEDVVTLARKGPDAQSTETVSSDAAAAAEGNDDDVDDDDVDADVDDDTFAAADADAATADANAGETWARKTSAATRSLISRLLIAGKGHEI